MEPRNPWEVLPKTNCASPSRIWSITRRLSTPSRGAKLIWPVSRWQSVYVRSRPTEAAPWLIATTTVASRTDAANSAVFAKCVQETITQTFALSAPTTYYQPSASFTLLVSVSAFSSSVSSFVSCTVYYRRFQVYARRLVRPVNRSSARLSTIFGIICPSIIEKRILHTWFSKTKPLLTWMKLATGLVSTSNTS